MSKRIALAILALGVAVCLSGCGGSGSKPVSVAVAASSTTVDGSDTVTLTATVTNDKNSAGVNWTVSGAGTLSNTTTTSATYTAPAPTNAQQTATVTATSIANSSKSGSATLTVPAMPAVTSTSANLTGAVGTAFSVSLQASGGIPPFTWALGAGTTLPACLTLKSNGTLTTASGTAPTASCAGSYTNLTFKATDSGTPTPLSVTSSPLTITITAPTISFTPTLPGGNVGVAYTGSVAATGVVGASTYVIASGSLPADLSLNSSTGAITGTPKAADAGTASFTVTVTDAYGDTATSGSLSIAIAAAPAITFTGSVPTTGTYGVAFSGSAAATGGAGALTYSISTGALPSDLSLNSSSGAITGTPGKAADLGTFNFTVKAADAYGDSATQSYALTISYAAMSVTQRSLPTAYVAGLYTQSTLSATGGTGTASNYSWQVTGGALPGGLSLSTAGVISGTLLNTDTTGTDNFTVKVTDTVANLSATGSFSIVVDAGVSITTTTLPTGYTGSSYSQQLTASGGTGTGYQWIVTGGTILPSGLTLSAGGLLSGTPANPGTTSVTFNVVDSVGNSATATLSITIDPGLSIAAPPLASGYPGTAYTSSAFTASGGSGTGYTWSWAAASGSTLPNGLSIGSSTGVISGTPANTGTTSVISSVVVTATDSVGNKGSTTVSITIEATLVVASPATLPGVAAGVNPNYALTASGGSGTYTTWAVTSGASSLTAVGLAVSSSGVLAGANPQAGTATFAVTVTDSEGHVSAAATLSVTVTSGVTLPSTNPSTLGSADAASPYSGTVVATGGSGNYSWTITGMPADGLSASTSGGTLTISGTPASAETVSFTAKITDTTADQSFGPITYTVTVNNALSISTLNGNPLANGFVGVNYTSFVVGSGGSGNLAISASSGLPADNLSAVVSGSELNIQSGTGGPTTAEAVPFTVKLTDTTTSSSVTKSYTLTINTPNGPVLPNASTAVPGPAIDGQAYSASLTAGGGVGPTYTWTVNGAAVPTTGSLALGTSGLSSQFSVSNSGGSGTLSITGNPTSTGELSFTAEIEDNTTGKTSNTLTYSIPVGNPGQTVSGVIGVTNPCGGTTNSNLAAFQVSLSTSPEMTTTSNSDGSFSFSGVPNGTWLVTPSITGPGAAFYGPNRMVTMAGADVINTNFQAALGYTVSGSVSYSGANTGQIYLDLVNSSCPYNPVGYGTSISAAGDFSIRGVAPGTYSLEAIMDLAALGEEQPNAADPTGSASGLSVSFADLPDTSVTMNDPTGLTVGSGPRLFAVAPQESAVVISFGDVGTAIGQEEYTSYTVQWSTTTGGFSSSNQATFKATGINGSDVWIVDALDKNFAGSLANGTAYYFRAMGTNPAGNSPWSYWGGPSTACATTSCAITVTIGSPSEPDTVSGTITIPAGVTIDPGAVLYAGLYDENTNTAYADAIASPVSGANSYSVNVPNGSSYILFGILDENSDGLIDVGDVSNVANNSNNSAISISGSTSGEDVTLPSTSTTSSVLSTYIHDILQGGSSSTRYLTVSVEPQNKLPVAVTLTSGPNLVTPIDLSNLCSSCSTSIAYEFEGNVFGNASNVGDPYVFTVTYSDGTQDTNVTANVTAFGSTTGVVGSPATPTSLAPSGTSSTSTTPTFTWTDPTISGASTYEYQFQLTDSGGNQIWMIPSSGSNSNGFGSSITSITWGTDPTGDTSNTPSVSSLTSGETYYWLINVIDSHGNVAETYTWYQP